MAIERTLSIIKPDAVAKNVIGKIYSRFETNGLKVIASKMAWLSPQEAGAFYAVHKERPFFKDLVSFMISGPVMVQVEYLIDPAEGAAFSEVMQATRAARLRQGALSWGLFRDTAVPGRYVEYFVDENWVEHLRRQERFTAADEGLRARRLAFHRGVAPPVVKRYVADGAVPEPGGLM